MEYARLEQVPCLLRVAERARPAGRDRTDEDAIAHADSGHPAPSSSTTRTGSCPTARPLATMCRPVPLHHVSMRVARPPFQLDTPGYDIGATLLWMDETPHVYPCPCEISIFGVSLMGLRNV